MEEGALSQIKQSLAALLSDVEALFNTYLSLFLLPPTPHRLNTYACRPTHARNTKSRQIDITKQSSYTYTYHSSMYFFIYVNVFIWAFDPCLEPCHVDSIGVIYFYSPKLQGASLTMSSCFSKTGLLLSANKLKCAWSFIECWHCFEVYILRPGTQYQGLVNIQ